MNTRTVAAAIVAGTLLILGRGALAQEVDRFQRNLQEIQRDTQMRFDAELPPEQRALIDYGGYLTLGYLSFDDSTHDNHALRQYEMVGYSDVKLDNANEFYVRGRADYYNYNSGDSFERTPDRLEGRVEEGWYRFNSHDNLSVKAGRQFVSWGNGLTLDQYADGLLGQFRGKNCVIDGLACVTVKETIDFDLTRPEFDHNTHRGYFGGRIGVPIGPHTPYAFFLLQRDFNRDESTTTHVVPTRYRYDSYYGGIGSNGAVGDHIAYAAEFCYEGGNSLSNSFDRTTNNPIPQTADRIEAWAANFRLDYLFNDPRKSRLTAEVVVASGDNDRAVSSGTFDGNRPHTADNGFNGLGVIYDGLAFTPPVSNLIVFRIGASTYPIPAGALQGLQTGADLFFFEKSLGGAPIDESTNDKRYLGCEPDLFVNWQIVDDVTFSLRYGLFFPGEAIPHGEPNHIRQFLYAAVTYAF